MNPLPFHIVGSQIWYLHRLLLTLWTWLRAILNGCIVRHLKSLWCKRSTTYQGIWWQFSDQWSSSDHKSNKCLSPILKAHSPLNLCFKLPTIWLICLSLETDLQNTPSAQVGQLLHVVCHWISSSWAPFRPKIWLVYRICQAMKRGFYRPL